MYLVSGDSLSPEQRESYMSERPLLFCAASPILARHDPVIGCRTAKCDSISLVVGAHASKSTASGYAALEMVDV